MSPLTTLLLIPIMGLIAAAYASVGLGGGTAYLSVLAVWDTDPHTIRPMAWTLNVVVSAIGFINFYRQRHFSWNWAWPFLLGGLAGGAVGASFGISVGLFKALLALTLGVVGTRMLMMKAKSGANEPQRVNVLFSLALGLVVGVVSGLVGIGGGIILGPIVVALGLLDMKRMAAMTSLYIFVSSLAALGMYGLMGRSMPWERLGLFAVVVAVAGFIGSRWGANRASPRTLQRIFGIVACSAATKLVLTTLWPN